jgi:hypothetical protein
VQIFKNLPIAKVECDEFEHVIGNRLLNFHFSIPSLILLKVPKKSSISPKKPNVTNFLGEKVVGSKHDWGTPFES